MNRMPGRLGTLVARDVMSVDVLVLTESMTLEEAGELLRERQHSGAPVIDSHGVLIGTFSLRNLTGIKPSDPSTKRNDPTQNIESGIISSAALEQMMNTALAAERVADRMTAHAPSVSENASLIDVARLMCGFHTHRIPVTSTRGKLTGIITTMDVLAALVHTADEMID